MRSVFDEKTCNILVFQNLLHPHSLMFNVHTGPKTDLKSKYLFSVDNSEFLPINQYTFLPCQIVM